MYTPFKMNPGFNKLPPGVQAKILKKAPTKMYGKSPAQANGETGGKIKDALKTVYKNTVPPVMQKLNEKIFDKGKEMYNNYKENKTLKKGKGGHLEALTEAMQGKMSKIPQQNKKTNKTSKPLQSDVQRKKIINSVRGKVGDGSDKSNFVNKVVSKGGASTQNKKESTTLENLTTTKKSMATKKKKAAPKYKKPAPIKNYKKGYYGA